eukprot:5698070-Prymnesium_polylepis.1
MARRLLRAVRAKVDGRVVLLELKHGAAQHAQERLSVGGDVATPAERLATQQCGSEAEGRRRRAEVCPRRGDGGQVCCAHV